MDEKTQERLSEIKQEFEKLDEKNTHLLSIVKDLVDVIKPICRESEPKELETNNDAPDNPLCLFAMALKRSREETENIIRILRETRNLIEI